MSTSSPYPVDTDPNDGTTNSGDSDPLGYRTLPHNLDAERGLLGAVLLDNRAYERVSEFMEPEHFAMGQHGRIYDACSKLIERGQLANPTTLMNYFEKDETFKEIGGPKYLGELVSSAVTVINAGEYGRLIYDLHLKRELIALGNEIVDTAYSGEVDAPASTQIEEAEQTLYDLATTGSAGDGFKPFKDAIIATINTAEEAHKRDGSLAGVTTGLKDLDRMLGGLHRSDLLILAARPAMGKTALVTNIAFNAAKTYSETNGEEGAVVGFFSLEMSAEQLAGRILSEQTEIASDKMRKGEVPNEQFPRLVAAAQTLYSIPIFIDDTPALTVSALRTRARRLKRQHNLGLIIIDYLQLVSGSNKARADGRVQEVSEITRGFKTLAKELDIPVIALSQLSRQVENRDDKRPQLSDLRESGSIEQDADVVMFIYRDEYYMEKQEPMESDKDYATKYAEWSERMEKTRNLADVIIAKQRHGPVGTAHMMFQGQFARFCDLDTRHDY